MTTLTAPAQWAALETALRQRRPLRLHYNSRQRLVSPHALGWKNGRAMLLAYQAETPTTIPGPPSDPRRQWRNMFVDQIEQVIAASPDEKWQTADNYNPGHPFNSIDNLAIAITPNDPPDPS
ncbi:MAG: WYL domain-containing protein [Actinomycetota bacterium]|nr:WYL domain-containing protein [Actinomycetota bacterium]